MVETEKQHQIISCMYVSKSQRVSILCSMLSNQSGDSVSWFVSCMHPKLG